MGIVCWRHVNWRHLFVEKFYRLGEMTMSEWQDCIEVIPERSAIKLAGDLRISIDERPAGNHWQHCQLSFGEIAGIGSSFEHCMKTWPSKVIAELRSKLDEWESELCTEPTSK
jgi:hypothetical protein